MWDTGLILVALIRLLGPLLIFRHPILGVILSQFVFDTFDVVIWDYTASNAIQEYTFYDKFFDTYQLIIMALVAYSWKDAYPRNIALRIFAFRMIGFILYEITRQRIFFFLFPNLFGLYFLGYYLSKKYGKSRWFLKKKYLWRALGIMLLLKMPQEFILHFAEIPTWPIIRAALRLP